MKTLVRSKEVQGATKCSSGDETIKLCSEQIKRLIAQAVKSTSGKTGNDKAEDVVNDMVDIIELVHLFVSSTGIDPKDVTKRLFDLQEEKGNIVGYYKEQ